MAATIIRNGVSCTITDSVLVKVLPPLLPDDGFTPNGDGTNDTWEISFVENFPNAIVEIYNRWGVLLFKSDPGYKNKWTGTYNGKPLPIGTYYFIIDLKDPEYPDPYTGPVSILR